MSRRAPPRVRGAVALEYILLVALVALALIAAFRQWGEQLSQATRTVVTDTSGALRAP